MPRKMANLKEWQEVSAPSENWTLATWLSGKCLNHWAMSSYWSSEEGKGIWLVVSRNQEPLFCVQGCCPQIAQVEYQGQARKTRILERKPWIDASYRIQHRLELKYFHFTQFLLIAHRGDDWAPQKSEKLELEISSWDISSRSGYGWLVSHTADDCLQRQTAQNSLNRKSKLILSTQVTTWLSNIAFHLQPIRLQVLVAINSESCISLFPSFCAPPSEVAVLFNSNLSLFLVGCQSSALHWIQFRTCCFIPISSIKTLFTLELSQYCKTGSIFSSSEPVAASSDCSRLEKALCLCLLVQPAQAVQESCPKSLAVDCAL